VITTIVKLSAHESLPSSLIISVPLLPALKTHYKAKVGEPAGDGILKSFLVFLMLDGEAKRFFTNLLEKGEKSFCRLR